MGSGRVRFIIIITVLAAVIATFVLWRSPRVPAAVKVVVPIRTEVVPQVKRPLETVPSTTDSIGALVAAVKQKKPDAIPPRRGVPYDQRLHALSVMNPELGLTPTDVHALQSIYSDYCRVRADFETTIASVATDPDGAVITKIPPYPAEAKLLQSEMLRDVDAYFGGATAPALRETLGLAFAGDNNDLGANLQTLTAKAVTVPNNRNRYEITRDVMFGSPGGNFSGSTSSTSQIRDIDSSPYAGQQKFFPQ